jgi:hypothetical protein
MNLVPFKDALSSETNVFFVLTSECLNLQSSTPCTQNSLATMVFDEQSNFGFTPPYEYRNPRGLGKMINEARFPRSSQNFDISGRPRAYIYCPPCSCHIHTAHFVCRELQELHSFWSICLRPDDRLTASCCYKENRLSWLEALVETSKAIEAKTYLTKLGEGLFWSPRHIAHLDRTWIEQRIFEVEQDQGVPLSVKAQDLRGICEAHRHEYGCPVIVILGELSHSGHLMQSAPFWYNTKPQKETQTYKFEKKSDAGPWNAKFVGTYTPKNFTASAASLTRPLPSNLPSLVPSVPINAPKGPKRPRLNDQRMPMATSAEARDYEGMGDLYDA